jgi:protein-tyrosine phosphatase
LREKNVLEKIHYSIMSEEPVLVHCFAGMQRSCTVVACYLMKYYYMTPYDAIMYIQSKRPVAFFGNVNFLHAIKIFYKNHRNEIENENQ